MNMKKFISVILTLAMLSVCIPAVVSADEADVTGLLSGLKIMQGDPDGNMRLNDYVSRAEFAKIAVTASKYKDSVALSSKVSPFSDVHALHWAAPYVQVGVYNGLCKGYMDSTFRPDGTVLYEEAITILLRVLGYSDDDFGASWPYGQVGTASSLEMTKNVSAGMGQYLNRRDVANLVYNTLDTKMKDSTQKLITIFDCQIVENAVLIATNNEDSSVGSNKVYTSSGLLDYTGAYFDNANVGRRGDLVIKNGDDFVSFTPDEQIVNTYNVTSVIGQDLVLNGEILSINENLTTYYKSQTSTYKNVVNSAESGDTFITFANANGVVDYAMLVPTHNQTIDINTNSLEKYVVYSKLDNAIIGYKNGVMSQIDIKDSTTAYKNKSQATYAAIKSELSMGDLIYVKKDSSGVIQYVSYEKGSMDGPVTVSGSGWMSSFATDQNTSVMRNGSKVSSSDIQNNDIVYFSKDLNMVLAYSNKITGVYEKATPNKDMPETVTVSGVEYTIESVAAFNKLSSSGNLEYGDTVTLLLGKTNQIADVATSGNVQSDVLGYLYETGTKEYTSADTGVYKSNYIKIVLPDGNTCEYIADTDYDSFINSVVKVTFSNGTAKASKMPEQTAVYGDFDWSAKTLGNSKVSDNVNIIDISTTDKKLKGEYVKIFPQRIDGLNLASSKIYYAKKDTNGVITDMILNNATGDMYDYGVITTADKSVSTGRASYSYIVNGNPYSFSSESVYSVTGGTPVKLIYAKGGSVETFSALNKVSGAVTEVNATAVVTSSDEYTLSDKVVVYAKDYNYNYNIIPLNDLINDSSDYILTAYYDKEMSSGGRVRVIIATKK